MKKTILIFASIFIIFSACKKEESTPNYEQMILGTWEVNSMTAQHREGYIVNGIKTYTYIDDHISTSHPWGDLTYEFSEEQVIMTMNEGSYYGGNFSQELDYNINGNLMEIYDEEYGYDAFVANWEISDISNTTLEVIYDDFHPGENPNDTTWFNCDQGQLIMTKIQ